MQKPVYGATVGTFLGKPIYQSVESDGVRYDFSRMAECDSDGCPLQQLARNEMMLKSGLIYTKSL